MTSVVSMARPYDVRQPYAGTMLRGSGVMTHQFASWVFAIAVQPSTRVVGLHVSCSLCNFFCVPAIFLAWRPLHIAT